MRFIISPFWIDWISNLNDHISNAGNIARVFFTLNVIFLLTSPALGQIPTLKTEKIEIAILSEIGNDYIIKEASWEATFLPAARIFGASRASVTYISSLEQISRQVQPFQPEVVFSSPPAYFAERQTSGSHFDYQIVAQSALPSATAVWITLENKDLHTDLDLLGKRLALIQFIDTAGGFLQITNLIRKVGTLEESKVEIWPVGSDIDALNYLDKGLVDAAAIPESSLQHVLSVYPVLQQRIQRFRILPEKQQGLGYLAAVRSELVYGPGWYEYWSRLITESPEGRKGKFLPAHDNQYGNIPRNVRNCLEISRQVEISQERHP